MVLTLPAVITPALLSSIRRHPHLPRHTWYYITATALTALNRPDEIPKVYKHALDHGPDGVDATPDHGEQLTISRRMREALLKTAAVVGLPKVNTTIAAWGFLATFYGGFSPRLMLARPRQSTPCWS